MPDLDQDFLLKLPDPDPGLKVYGIRYYQMTFVKSCITYFQIQYKQIPEFIRFLSILNAAINEFFLFKTKQLC